jgi:redox-sensitive bicupin YhaK (pirin superfamily)
VHQILSPSRYGWLQVAHGEVGLNGVELRAGDGAAISSESDLEIASKTGAEFLLFDLK